MQQRANERIAYFNGEYLPESRVVLPFRDRGFLYGDGVFDTTRTFGHRLFKVKEHIDRLYRSLRYLRLDPGLSPAEMAGITEAVLERNRHLLGPDEDYWVSQRVSRGPSRIDGEEPVQAGPTVIVECTPLPLRERAGLYRDGIRVVVPSNRRTPPDALTPRAKTTNYLNMIVADQEVTALDPGAWAVLLDMNGNLAEGRGSNIFLVRKGELLTPGSRYVLPGISRETVIELAAELETPCREADLDLYDAYNADEAFLTSTSLCICPVRSINGVRIGGEAVFGPVTRRLVDAYVRLVGCDFVGQYLRRLG
ncbi:aminotransferase class IV [Benzoatithermus flavus]|uniref:Probable branched-chain-amino-acid aminotransferase n=1 Tax=Benzoatithermus flavus TaxID=3108223 RepID=A0ABU8XKK0_9PROT